LTAEQKDRLKERKRYQQEALKLHKQGKLLEAVAAEKMLAINREVLGDTHDAVADALQLLAEIHEERSDFPAARKARKDVLSIRTHHHGDQHWKALDARRALADTEHLAQLDRVSQHQWLAAGRLMRLVLRQRQAGKYGEALANARQALALRKVLLGEQHRDTASSMLWVGVLLAAQGEYRVARPYVEQALAIDRRVLGDRHPDTATALGRLGNLLQDQGDFAAARPYLEQGLAICQDIYGTNHSDTAKALHNLGDLLQAQGDLVGARVYLEQALAIRQRVLGADHPATATSLSYLGGLLHRQRDYAGAGAYYKQTLTIFQKVYGERHPATASVLGNLGSLLRSQGDYAGARAYLEQALLIQREVLGNHHPETAHTLNALGLLLKTQGDYRAARPYLEEALTIRRKVLGDRHPVTATSTSLCHLGGVLRALKKDTEARACYEQALDISRTNLDLAAAAQSERQQLAMTHSLRSQLDAYLSLAAQAHLPAERAYHEVLAWKGTILARQRRLRSERSTPELQALVEKLRRTTNHLASLAFAIPDPTQQVAWRKQLAQLTQEKEQIESELARRSPAFRQQQQRLSPTALRDLLPRDTALIDFLVYDHSTVPPDKESKSQWERRLIAFVVAPGRPRGGPDPGAVSEEAARRAGSVSDGESTHQVRLVSGSRPILLAAPGHAWLLFTGALFGGAWSSARAALRPGPGRRRCGGPRR
jgi:tetratricopeptide (TPR) repeat protein